MDYPDRLRSRKASELLLQNRKISVVDVAFMCGFSSSQYFNYAFKKHFKMTPMQLRKIN